MFSSLLNAIREFRATRMGNRAFKALRDGNLTKCVELNLKALALMERAFGEIPQTIIYVWNLAEAYNTYGRYEEAESYYRRILGFLEGKPGLGPIDLASVRARLTTMQEGLQVNGVEQQGDLDKFLRYFYKTRNIAAISSSMAFLDKVSAIPVENLSGPVAGFYSEVFRSNTDMLQEWIALIDGFSERGKKLFLRALWMSSAAEAKQYLKRHAEKVADDSRSIIRNMVQSEPANMRTMIISSPEQEDMQWGAFFATGDPIFVYNIIAASAGYNNREDYQVFISAAAAKWSLASNAQQHKIVCHALEKVMSESEGEERDIIRDIIGKSNLPAGPSILLEETSRILEEQKRRGLWIEFLGE